MKYLQSFFLVVGAIAFVLLIGGIYKPWIVLWWKEKQNRRKVIKLYGSIALICFLLHASLRLIWL